DALAGRLTAYWHARDRFIEAGAALPGGPRGRAPIEGGSPCPPAAGPPRAPGNPPSGPFIGLGRSLMGSAPAAAARLLHEIDDAAPSRSEARELLWREFGR